MSIQTLVFFLSRLRNERLSLKLVGDQFTFPTFVTPESGLLLPFSFSLPPSTATYQILTQFHFLSILEHRMSIDVKV